MKHRFLYVDPQSYHNLALYDWSLLSNVDGVDGTFIGNKQYALPEKPLRDSRLWFSYSSKKTSMGKAISYSWTLIRIAFYVLIHCPKVVHFQWLKWFPADRCLLWLLRKLRIRIIYTAHNVLPHDTGIKFQKQYARYYQIVNKIIVHTNATKTELCSKFGNNLETKIEVIPHGIFNVDVLAEHTDDWTQKIAAKKKEMGLQDQIVFGLFGLQSIYKGSDWLAQIWAETRVLQDATKYHLLIVGINESVDFSCLDSIHNITKLESFVSEEDFIQYMSLTDVVVLPYRCISQSGVLMTALQLHKPIIVTPVGGLTDPLKIAPIGWCAKEVSKQAILDVLLCVGSQPNQIRNIQQNENAWEEITKYYDWVQIGKMYAKLYLGKA